MAKSIIKDYLSLRLLVGFLGERTQFSWWATSFYGDYSLRSLEFVTPRTSQLAQYHGVLEAARRLHDEHLNVGCYHLFRLHEEVEQDLHAIMQSSVGVELCEQVTQGKDSAMQALKMLARSSIPVGPGPIAVGNINQLYAESTLSVIAAGYYSAFSQSEKTYPYLVGNHDG